MHHCLAGQLAIVPLAALAALGWWVLRVNEKDAAGPVKWAGRVTGWALVVIGLTGAACAGMSHIKSKIMGGASCATAAAPAMMNCDHAMGGARSLPPGHPPIGDAEEASPAKKK